MSEDKGKSVKAMIADEAKALGVEVYRDAAKPAVSQVGQLVSSVTKLVLWPIKLAFDTANAALDRLSDRVAAKAAGIPPERLLAAWPAERRILERLAPSVATLTKVEHI